MLQERTVSWPIVSGAKRLQAVKWRAGRVVANGRSGLPSKTSITTPGNRGLPATPTAAVRLALFTLVMQMGTRSQAIGKIAPARHPPLNVG